MGERTFDSRLKALILEKDDKLVAEQAELQAETWEGVENSEKPSPHSSRERVSSEVIQRGAKEEDLRKAARQGRAIVPLLAGSPPRVGGTLKENRKSLNGQSELERASEKQREIQLIDSDLQSLNNGKTAGEYLSEAERIYKERDRVVTEEVKKLLASGSGESEFVLRRRFFSRLRQAARDIKTRSAIPKNSAPVKKPASGESFLRTLVKWLKGNS